MKRLMYLLYIFIFGLLAPIVNTSFAGHLPPHGKPVTSASALLRVAWNGDMAALAKLLKAGANINEKLPIGKTLDLKLLNNAKGVTALMLACFKGHKEMVQMLLQVGAHPDEQDSAGQTALWYAILNGKEWPHKPLTSTQTFIIKLLLKHDANPLIIDDLGNDAAYYYGQILKSADEDANLASDPLYRQLKMIE